MLNVEDILYCTGYLVLCFKARGIIIVIVGSGRGEGGGGNAAPVYYPL